MWRGIDRRRFPRADYKCLITIAKKGAERRFLTHTENIGVGGICVVLEEDIGLFSEVEVELMLKNGNPPLHCGGTIVWVIKRTEVQGIKSVVKFDTGVEFVGLKEQDKVRIEKIVDDIIKSENQDKEVKK